MVGSFESIIDFFLRILLVFLDPRFTGEVGFLAMPCEEERPVLAWLQLSLVQFLIANCLEIFGEDVPSPLGESSGMVVPVRLQVLCMIPLALVRNRRRAGCQVSWEMLRQCCSGACSASQGH